VRISIELVPRTAAQLLADAGRVVARYPRIATLNLPDAARFELDSIAAAARLHGVVSHRIPHLRARAFTAASAESLIERLAAAQIREAIVVAGDEQNGTAAHAPFTPVELIRFLRTHAPWLATYAALDPHRLKGDALAANVDAKRAAGVTGFFSQPLYELEDLERCTPLMGALPVFWGLSPVTTLRTQRYWENVNGVRFPADFEPTLGWSHTFGRRVMTEVAARGHHLYLMPITVDVTTYLDGLALAA
jgi:methylenetetrahydrofolate reductase (NADPH)